MNKFIVAFVIPLAISQAVMQDISVICQQYPFPKNGIWYEDQQKAWEHQGYNGEPKNVKEINDFCLNKGYK